MSFFKNFNYLKARNLLLLIVLIVSIFMAIKASYSTKDWDLEDGIKTYKNPNNYMIYQGVFRHILEKKNLYDLYPAEYHDRNHYGPIFGLIIAPFTLLPHTIGVILWVLVNSFLLVYALSKLPFTTKQQFFVLLLLVNDFANSALNTQVNSSMAAMIILAFVFTIHGKDHWATFFIFLGFFIKLYTIVGLAFFFFSKNKIRYVGYCMMWCVVFFVLPMTISSPDYIIQCYQDWYEELVNKNSGNLVSGMQDMSIQGVVRYTLGDFTISGLPFFVVGTILYGLSYLKVKQFKEYSYRVMLLVLTLILPVIVSSGSESPTYIIAVSGIAIWAVWFLESTDKVGIVLLIIAVLLTILSSTDIYPKFVRDEYLYPYKVKAIGATLVWLYAVYQMITTDFRKLKIAKDE